MMTDDIAEKLRAALPPNALVQYYAVPLFVLPASSEPTRTADQEAEDRYDIILYIGGESLGLTNLLVTHSSANVRPALLL